MQMISNINEAFFRQSLSKDINPLIICIHKVISKCLFEHNHKRNDILSPYDLIYGIFS